jgi:hypothetical protein
MSAFMHHVAGAALPVAIGLLVLAAVARGALAARVEERFARLYLEPLSTWAAIAFAVYLFAVVAAGDPGVLPIAAGIALGATALLLREPGQPVEAAPAAAPPRPRPAATPPSAAAAASPRAPAPTPPPAAPAAAPPPLAPEAPASAPQRAPGGPLWDRPVEQPARTGLWSHR